MIVDNNVIGNRIRELRKTNNMTQEDLAKMFSITYTSVSYWENGTTKPDIMQMQKLAELFNVSIDYLCGKKDINFNKENKSEYEMDILFRKAKKLDDSKKTKLNSILKTTINVLWDDDGDKESKL